MVSPVEPLSCLSVLDVRNGTLLSQTCSGDMSMHTVMFDRGTNRMFVSAYYTVRALDIVYEVLNFSQPVGAWTHEKLCASVVCIQSIFETRNYLN